jgi:urease accessory protein
MRRVIEAVPHGAWPRKRRVGLATLDFDHRHRRRIALATDDGNAFLLDLPEARVLGPGDGLILETGDVIEVVAANEKVCDVVAETPTALAPGPVRSTPWRSGPRSPACRSPSRTPSPPATW